MTWGADGATALGGRIKADYAGLLLRHSVMTDQPLTGTRVSPEPMVARDRGQLVRLHLEVLACPPSEARQILLREIAGAQEQLEGGDSEYARHLYDQTASSLIRLRRRQRFGVVTPESAVSVILLGVMTYSVGV